MSETIEVHSKMLNVPKSFWQKLEEAKLKEENNQEIDNIFMNDFILALCKEAIKKRKTGSVPEKNLERSSEEYHAKMLQIPRAPEGGFWKTLKTHKLAQEKKTGKSIFMNEFILQLCKEALVK